MEQSATKFKEDFSLGKEEVEWVRPSPSPSAYIIEPGLDEAVRVAVLLKLPLLLTGKPGTGKTRLAGKLAHHLHNLYNKEKFLPIPLVFHTKTISTFTDLFYIYDALGHFQAVHNAQLGNTETGKNTDHDLITDFVQLQAFGQAILLANPQYKHSYQNMPEVQGMLKEHPELKPPLSSVVLIDEIDKAPRDFPNDLLNEFDRFEFKVREHLGSVTYRLKPDRSEKDKPVESGNVFLVLTSNSERSLPDAFLRRCVFYHIGSPDSETLRKIVISQVFAMDTRYQKIEKAEDAEDLAKFNALIGEYVDLFDTLRKNPLEKEPSTAELVSWLLYLRDHLFERNTINEIKREILEASLSILAKNAVDLAEMKSQLNLTLKTQN